MKDYLTACFRHFGCDVQAAEQGLTVTLTPELAAHFGKPALRLVFAAAAQSPQVELAAPGSYVTTRLYELLRQRGARLALQLPPQPQFEIAPPPSETLPFGLTLHGWRLHKQRSQECLRTESFLTFHIAYFSNEKSEELLTVGIDSAGRLFECARWPYTPRDLQDAAIIRFPFSKARARALYDACLTYARTHAEQHALTHQETLLAYSHHDLARIKGYYQQMIAELPELAFSREDQARQLQQEYEVKAAEELQRCQVQVAVTPVNWGVVAIPFRRHRFTLKPAHADKHARAATVEIYQNLTSGAVLYAHCETCAQPLTAIGICEANMHPVCQNCLTTCTQCGKQVCQACGISACAHCHAVVCHACSDVCHVCGQRVCAEHLLGCVSCRQSFCPECAVRCEECGRAVDPLHVLTCEVSQKRVCLACVVTCACCDRHVSKAYAATCAFCGQQMCVDCRFSCDVCGQVFCVHHVTECEASHAMVCQRHLGVCDSCGLQVSTKLLVRCDECNKPICAACAIQCQGCQLFFCHEHAAEMHHCPACGRAYCSLCYAGQGRCRACQRL